MLWRKMRRDLWENKGAYLACMVIIVIGLMIFTSFSLVVDNLFASQDSFYRAHNFADGFIQVEEMPAKEVEKLQDIAGIEQIQGRLVRDVRALLPGREESVYLRLVSLDTSRDSIINDVDLMLGSPLHPADLNIWVDNKFFAANGLELNQELEIIIGGAKKSVRVIGMGRSPEFVYALRTNSDLYPNPELFGIAFLPFETMKNLLAQGEIVNNIVFTLTPGADYEDVKVLLQPELTRYGLKSIISRKDQISHLLLSEEIKGIDSFAASLPVLFLAISAMILFITLKRMIERQRGQIGILKALGYQRREILFHYLSYAVIIGGLGGFCGCVAGTMATYPLMGLYMQFFNMPGLTGRISGTYFLWGIALSLGFSLFAGYWGSKGALRLEPAEAMRPPAPIMGQETLLERVQIFWNMLTVQGKIAVRNLSRHPGRTAFMFLGIMFTFALLCLPYTFKDMTDQMLFDQFEKVQTYNVKISLAAPAGPEGVISELTRFPGVNRAEPLAEIPVTLNNEWRAKDAVILGLSPDSQLYHILDKNDREVQPPQEGVLLSERLAEVLDAEVGSRLDLSSLLLKDGDSGKEVAVTGIVPQYMGLNCFMEIEALQELLGESSIATSVILDIDEDQVTALQEEYRNTPAINGIDHTAATINQYQSMMGALNGSMFVMIILGMITGFAIIYNAALVSLSERSRDLATMLVLGMTAGEVLSVVTFEQWFLAGFAMLAGIPLTKLLLVGMAQSFSTDLYSIPMETSSLSFVIAFVFTVCSIWMAQRIAAKKIRSLDLVEVLKERE